jgi:non-specific serine/threonine protein kinase
LELAAAARGEAPPVSVTYNRATKQEIIEEIIFPLTNLPLPLTSFIGREQEIALVQQLMMETRLVTLTGPGGCGKSRLAVEAARQLIGRYQDGVWLVELAPLSDDRLIPQVVAAVLGVPGDPARPLLAALTDFLCARQILLLLDNCEHLIKGVAQLAETLLQACPSVNLLATSRETVNLAGEASFYVPTLTLPDPGSLLPLESVAGYEAVRLFCERTRSMLPGFTLTADNAAAVTQVCYRLDGIPLAIELAAARMKIMSVEQIAQRLGDRFQLLIGGHRTALPRQQTLRALIDWSYDLLTGSEQVLLCRLSLFAGGWALETAEAVCADEQISQYDILELLSQLVNKSLVLVNREQGRANRYYLLETIRQYAREKLEESGMVEQFRHRCLVHFCQLAVTAEAQLHGWEQIAWLERLETENGNFRAILEWSLAILPSQALRLAGTLVWFWNMRSYIDEGRTWLNRVLALPGMDDYAADRAKALSGVGLLAWCQGDHAAAYSALEEATTLFRQTVDKQGLAEALYWLGLVLMEQGHRQAATEMTLASQTISQEIGCQWISALGLVTLGHLTYADNDPDAALHHLESSVELLRQVGDLSNLSFALTHLAMVLLKSGDFDRAETTLEEGLILAQLTGDRLGTAWITNELGIVAQQKGKYKLAETRYQAALGLFQHLGVKSGQTEVQHALSRLAQMVKNG